MMQFAQLYWALILLDLALYLPSACLSTVFILYVFKEIFFTYLLTSFSLPFSELSLVGLALDLVD